MPEQARGRPACGVILIYVGDPQDGERALRPLLEWGEPWLSMVQPMPYVAVQQLIDMANPWGISEYAKVDYLPELPDDAIEVMIAQASQAGSAFTEIIVCPLGGAVSRMDRSAMALTVPDAKWMYFCMAKSWDAAEEEREIAWARAFMAAMRPWSAGTAPANFLLPDEGTARLRASYGEDKLPRLMALKDRYDPENVFSLNANIPPSTTGG